jgi:putative ubiquitin-RnfH superfamily antitoxin RatB of RatAB toxin-antitoxin module
LADVRLRVSVVYCTPQLAWTREMEVAEGTTLRYAIENSGVLAAFPTLQLGEVTVGVFSKPRPLDAPARDGDRIEIYRPLVVDPKEARRVRAELRRRRKEGRGR